MPIHKIIDTIENLADIHQQLYGLSEQKTQAIKKNKMEQLQKLVVSEQKLVRELRKLENSRMTYVTEFSKHHEMENEEPGMNDMLQKITDVDEKAALEQAAVSLSGAVYSLREQEQLNQELIHQSLKFVHMSLDMVSPSLASMNYGSKNTAPSKQSMFDSKA